MCKLQATFDQRRRSLSGPFLTDTNGMVVDNTTHSTEMTMNENLKGLLAKTWKDESIDLEPGRYYCDEVLTVRVSGFVDKKEDDFAAPTVSIPLIPTLALFWEKCGITRDHAIRMLREAITEAMLDGVKEDDHIQAHIKDVETAIKAVRGDLIKHLPKMKRSGKVITKDLAVTVMVSTEQPFWQSPDPAKTDTVVRGVKQHTPYSGDHDDSIG